MLLLRDQELEEKLGSLQAQLNDANAKLDTAGDVTKRLREENQDKSEKLEKMQGSLIFTEEKLKSLQGRGERRSMLFHAKIIS